MAEGERITNVLYSTGSFTYTLLPIENGLLEVPLQELIFFIVITTYSTY